MLHDRFKQLQIIFIDPLDYVMRSIIKNNK